MPKSETMPDDSIAESVEAIGANHRYLASDEIGCVKKLLDSIRDELRKISGDDSELYFAIRRKIYKELLYDERGKPAQRAKLKALKYQEQNKICTHCKNQLPEKGLYAVLDRKINFEGYTKDNTDLIHAHCDREIQRSRLYK